MTAGNWQSRFEARIDDVANIIDEARGLVAERKFIDISAIEHDVNILHREIAKAPERQPDGPRQDRWIGSIRALMTGLDRLEGEVTGQIKSMEAAVHAKGHAKGGVGPAGAYIAQENDA